MKKLILISIVAMLFVSCSKYKEIKGYNYTRKIKLYYDNSIPISTYFTMLSDHPISGISNVKMINGKIFGTYATKINPIDIGYDMVFYPNLDTNVVLSCKFKFLKKVPLFSYRTKIHLYDFRFDGEYSTEFRKDLDDYRYREITEIISKKAFNDFELKQKRIKL